MSQSPGQTPTAAQPEPYTVPHTKPLKKPIPPPLIPSVTLGPPSRNSLQGSSPSESQLTVAAIDEVIRYGYGRVRIGAQVAYAISDPGGTLLVVCVHGRGPIEAVESFQIDNGPPVNVAWAHYLGDPGQGIDPWLQAAWAYKGVTYTDTMPGIAYTVLRFSPTVESGFDNITFVLKLAKCHDPRWWVLEGRFTTGGTMGVITHEADGGNVAFDDTSYGWLRLTNCTGGHAMRVLPFVAPGPKVRLDVQARLNGIVNPWGDGGTGADPGKAIFCAFSLYDPISNTSTAFSPLDVAKIAAKWNKQSITFDGLTRGRVYYIRLYTVPNANWQGSGNGKQLIDLDEIAVIPEGSQSRGRKLWLNGINNYASAPALTNLSGNAITVECWWQGTDFESVFRQQNGTYIVFGWRNGNATGDPKFCLSWDGATVTPLQGPASIQDGKLHHVAMVWEQNKANGFRLLVDGVRVAQRDSGNTAAPNINAAACIGAYLASGAEKGTGFVQELRVWSVARSDAEIAGAMFSRAAGNEAGLVACWHMDDDAGTTLKDATPNGHDATLQTTPKLNELVQTDYMGAGGWTFSNATPSNPSPGVTRLTLTGGNVTHYASIIATAGVVPDNVYIVASAKVRGDGLMPLVAFGFFNKAGTQGAFSFNPTTGAPGASSVDGYIITPLSGADAGWFRVTVWRGSATGATNPNRVAFYPGAFGPYNGDGSYADLAEPVLTYSATIPTAHPSYYAVGSSYAPPLGLAWLAQPFTPDTALAPGYAVRCDGVDDSVQKAAGASLNFGASSNITLECRVRVRAIPGASGQMGGILTRGGGVGRAWITAYNNGGALNFRSNCYFGAGMDYYSANVAAALNRWYHLAVVFDRNGDEVFYVDGVERSRITISAASAVAWDDSAALMVAGFINVNGAIDVDEVRVWKAARTAQEIKDGIAKRLTGAEANLLVYWRFDEGTGLAAMDRTANGNNGTLINGPTWVPGVPLCDTTKAIAYTTNPGLALGEFITNRYYGRGGVVDWPSVCDVAQIDDEWLGVAGQEERRRTIGFIVDEPSTVDNMEETLRGYAGCFIHREGGVTYLVPDAPAAAELSFTPANVVLDSLEITQRTADNMPTVVVVHYTDTSVTPWAEAQTDPLKAAGVDSGVVPYRVAHLQYPGIQRHSEAYRMAVRYLNEYTLADLSIKFVASDLAIRARLGTVFYYTDNEGFTLKPFRLLDAKQTSPGGRWEVQGTEYQPNAYSDDVQTVPAIGDTSLPNPNAPPAPTLSGPLVEEVYQEQTIGGFLSRVVVKWAEPAFPFTEFSRVTFKEQASGKIIAQADVGRGVGEFRTPAVAQGIIYRAEVVIVSTSGKVSDAAVATITAQGKLLAPQWAPGATLEGVEIGGEVILKWPAAVDLDITLYEVRYGTTSQTWEQMAANVLNRVSGLTTSVKGLPAATWRFRVKARDSVRNDTYPFGQETPTDIYKDIQITSDAGAFQLQQFAFASPTLTNMVAWNVPGDPVTTYITDPGGTWNAIFPGLMSTYINPLETYGAAVTSALETEAIDVGLKVTADIALAWDAADIAGTAVKKIYTSETSAAGPWVETIGLATKTSFRFVKARIETTGRMKVHGLPKINITISGREETGQVTTASQYLNGSTQVAALVALGNKYFSALDLQITAINTTSSRTGIADRITLYPENGLMFSWRITGSNQTTDNAYALPVFWTGSFAIAATDWIDYEIYVDPACPAFNTGTSPFNTGMTGALDCSTNVGAGRFASANKDICDTNGWNLRSSQPAELAARGQWLRRQASLASMAGETLTQLEFGGDSDNNGDYKVLFRNMRITNGQNGPVRLYIWPASSGASLQTEPAVLDKVSIVSPFTVNLSVGPANTFLVYLKNTSDTLVAGDARWRFKGV